MHELQRRGTVVGLLAILGATGAGNAGAEFLGDGFLNTGVFSIDTSSQTVTSVVSPLTGGLALAPAGAAYLNGTLYVSNFFGGAAPGEIGSVDTTTGMFTALAPGSDPMFNTAALAANTHTGTVVGVETDGSLYSYDPVTGVVTTLAETSLFDVYALAQNNVAGVGYAITLDDADFLTLWRLDENSPNPAPQVVANLGILGSEAVGLAYDPTQGELLMSVANMAGNSTEFFRLDPTSGFVLGNWTQSQAAIDNLAWVPAPGTAALLGAGGLVAARRRRTD